MSSMPRRSAHATSYVCSWVWVALHIAEGLTRFVMLQWMERYPNAKAYACPGLQEKTPGVTYSTGESLPCWGPGLHHPIMCVHFS